MSTRSRIGVTNPDGSVTSVYCHSDGYPEAPHGVGYKLWAYYQEPAKIAELIALGDLSALYEHISPPEGVDHSFEMPAPNVVKAYARDRGEKDVAAVVDPDVHRFLGTADSCGAEFAYLWVGTWVIWEISRSTAVLPAAAQPLELALVTSRLMA
mgnify:CR=1 FL=1